MLCTLSLALAATVMLAPASHAAEPYRYKDPFGTWRIIKVPNGYAKYYQRARQRAAGKIRGPMVGFDNPVSRGQRMGRLLAHAGSAEHGVLIAQAARTSGVDKALLLAVIAIESGFRPDARSPKGALGLMQLMPGTAAPLVASTNLEAALVDPAINVDAGSRHLRYLLNQYPGRVDLALAAYNAGEGAVAKYDGIPPYAETQQYVRDVMALYTQYRLAAAPHSDKTAAR
jgi:soluble lytic murein transglycosylase-like protein